MYCNTCLKRSFKKNTKIGFQDGLSLNAGQKYSKMLQGEHFAKLSTFIKLPFALRPLFCLFLSGRFRGFIVCIFQNYNLSLIMRVLYLSHLAAISRETTGFEFCLN